MTYLPGVVPQKWGLFSDQQIADAGRLLRAFHDATRGSTIAAGASVVCHNDFGPNNAVFVHERPVGMIDFDLAAPGEPLEDLGYTAWAWCISTKAHRPPVDFQAHQVRLLADAYGGLDGRRRMAIVDAVLERQERNARFWYGVLNHREPTVTSIERIPQLIAWSREEARFVQTNRRVFETALL